MAALANLSGLAKSIRTAALSGDSTNNSLSGYDESRTFQLVRDAFGTPQQLPAGVAMVRHTFKNCRKVQGEG